VAAVLVLAVAALGVGASPVSATVQPPLNGITLDFGSQRINTYSNSTLVPAGGSFVNDSSQPLTLSAIEVVGPAADDFQVTTSCLSNGAPVVLAGPHGECGVGIRFAPRHAGLRTATLKFVHDVPEVASTTQLRGIGTIGFYLADTRGQVAPAGDAALGFCALCDLVLGPVNAPVVALTATRNGAATWLLGADGGVFKLGNLGVQAPFPGSLAGVRLHRPVVAIESVVDGVGYWIVASDGGVFAFGDARFFGSTAGFPVGRVIGIAAMPDGGGYWIGGSDARAYSFGNAPEFQAIAPGPPAPRYAVVGIAPSASPLPPNGAPVIHNK
jgi:hypothetical protein